jgi:Ca-activated chloride channel family protein
MMMPPQASAINTQPLAREVIFVLDRSGSMAGRSFSQAKAALIPALKQLRPEDAFNLIAFSSDARQLFSESMPATDANIDNALEGISDLNAEGGTEMHYALSLALENQRPTEKVRQVVFITDGAVGNEAMLFDFIKNHLGQSRLFTVGIGSAPNSHFMTDAALLGKGTYTYIGNLSEVKREMTALFRRLESPLLTDIKIDFNGAPVQTYPEHIADLYAGEPLVVLLKAKELDQDIVVRGATGTNHWTQKVRLKNGHAHEGIARLYARRKVAAIERSLYGLADATSWRETQKAIKSEIIATGLQYQIVTKHTSLVAVEQESTVPFGENLKPWAAPINLPAGWEYGLDQSGPDTDALSQDSYYEDAAIGNATLMRASKVFARQERVDASAMSVADFSSAPATVAAVTESTDWCSRYPASFACVDDKHKKDQKGGTSKTQSSPPSAMQIAMGQILPRTATPAQMLLIIGMLLLMTAAVTRKKKLLKWR